MFIKKIYTNSLSEAAYSSGTKALSIEEFKMAIKEDALIVDTRPALVFTQGFVPGSIFLGPEERIAEWAGNILPFNKSLVLITPAGKEEETVIRLSRVGFDKILGYLQGGFEAWKNEQEKTDIIIDVEPDELMMDIPFDPNLVVVDVRRETEFADGHLANAISLPLDEMTDVVHMAQFEDNQNLYIHCEGGYRSVIAASLLKREGIHNLRNVLGGWSKIKLQEKAEIVKEASLLN